MFSNTYIHTDTHACACKQTNVCLHMEAHMMEKRINYLELFEEKGFCLVNKYNELK